MITLKHNKSYTRILNENRFGSFMVTFDRNNFIIHKSFDAISAYFDLYSSRMSFKTTVRFVSDVKLTLFFIFL